MEQENHNMLVKRAEALREFERNRLKRTPVRELARNLKAAQFFQWHAGQHYVECSRNGKRQFRLTAKNPARADGSGRRADSLNHPRTAASIWARVERIWERYA